MRRMSDTSCLSDIAAKQLASAKQRDRRRGIDLMLMKMALRREAGYRSLGYRPVRSIELALEQPSRERT
jgi:hypothetical protein